jgi:O-antigen ligase
VAVVVLAAAGLPLALAGRPPSAIALGVAGATLAVLALALARYDLVIGVGFLLLGIARIEPSPSDGLVAMAIALAFLGGGFDLRRVPPAMLVLVDVLIALNLVSAIGAVDLGEAARFTLITTYLAAFAVWLVTYLTSERRMRIVVGGYVAGAGVSALAGVLALFVPFPGHDLLIGEGARAQALLKDPNVFGPFLVPAAVIVLEEVLRPGLLRLRRRVSAPLLLVLTLGVVFSYSRAAWLNLATALFVMLVVFSLRRGGGRVVTAAVAVLLVGIALGATTIVATGSTGFLQERAQPHAYDAERFRAQRLGVELGSTRPFGIGPGQFDIVGPIASHSVYVRVLAEQGPLGLLTLLGLLGGTLAFAVGNAVAGRRSHGVGSAALLGAWCGLLVSGAFVDTLHWRHLWLVAALVWVGTAHRRHVAPR